MRLPCSRGKGAYYSTPLSVATEYEHFDLCVLLIKNGAMPYLAATTLKSNINNLKLTIETILSKPIIKPLNTNPSEYEMNIFNRFKNNDITGIYIKNINPNIIDNDGKHLLHYAIVNRYYINIASLFAMGANPNYPYNNDKTFYEFFIEELKVRESLLELFKQNMDEKSIKELNL